MKKLFITMLFTTGALTAQTTIDLSGMTGNITLGDNCSSSQTPRDFITTGDCNLNGWNVNLRNSTLKVTGRTNGNGSFTYCGQSTLCTVQGVQNNPNIPSGLLVDCTPLDTPKFDVLKDFGHSYELYDYLGRLVSVGVTHENLMYDFPSSVFLILKVEGFEVVKIYKRE